MTKEEILEKISEMLGLKKTITESELASVYNLFSSMKKTNEGKKTEN